MACPGRDASLQRESSPEKDPSPLREASPGRMEGQAQEQDSMPDLSALLQHLPNDSLVTTSFDFELLLEDETEQITVLLNALDLESDLNNGKGFSIASPGRDASTGGDANPWRDASPRWHAIPGRGASPRRHASPGRDASPGRVTGQPQEQDSLPDFSFSTILYNLPNNSLVTPSFELELLIEDETEEMAVLSNALDLELDLNSAAVEPPEAVIAPLEPVPIVSQNFPPIIIGRVFKNQPVFVMTKTLLDNWEGAIIVSENASNWPITYNVKLNETPARSRYNRRGVRELDLSGREIALRHSGEDTVRLPVGSRVIARYRMSEEGVPFSGRLYAGVVAESERPTEDGSRHLIFFDDGGVEYVTRLNIFPVLESSQHVWLDVHSNLRDFIKDYLMKYPSRHLFRCQIGHYFRLESSGKAVVAKVVAVDQSIMRATYRGQDRGLKSEWIYRGSSRILALFAQLANQDVPISSNVNYDILEEDIDAIEEHPDDGLQNGLGLAQPIYATTLPYLTHECSAHCADLSYSLKNYGKVSPLAIPLFLGWSRQVTKNGEIFYITPCGARCWCYEEIYNYMVLTQISIPIDFFSIDKRISSLTALEPSQHILFNEDISEGKELMPIVLVNSIDDEQLPKKIYLTKCKKGPQVGFQESIVQRALGLRCCDCKDDCKDKEKCPCWTRTSSGEIVQSYQNRRLKNPVPEGIFECNRSCSCRSTCFNRVAQNMSQWLFGVYRKPNKSWGVRVLCDMPGGTHVCNFTGYLLPQTTANMVSLKGGNNPYGELNFKESKQQTNGASVTQPLRRSRRHAITIDAIPDRLNFTSKSRGRGITLKRKADESIGSLDQNVNQPLARSTGIFPIRTVARPTTAGDDGHPAVGTSRNRHDLLNFGNDGEVAGSSRARCNPIADSQGQPEREPEPARETEPRMYIIDASKMGNFGAYINRSPNPNLFVQNVFVDTHDPRFPLLSLFLMETVKAGTELTWDCP